MPVRTILLTVVSTEMSAVGQIDNGILLTTRIMEIRVCVCVCVRV